MTLKKPQKTRCAIYTRKSSEEGLEQEFNSLDAQREACESLVQSQKHEGWIPLPDLYNDGGFPDGSMKRPALERLLEEIRDKIAASKKKGMWMGGNLPMGYDVEERELIIKERDADAVRHIYRRYLELGSVSLLKDDLGRDSITKPPRRRYRRRCDQQAASPVWQWY